MIVIRFFDKLFTVVKERTCNWDSIVGVYLLLVPTIYNLTSHLKYSYRNLTTKKPDRNNNKNQTNYITYVPNYYSTKSVVVIFKTCRWASELSAHSHNRTCWLCWSIICVQVHHQTPTTNMFFSASHPGSVVPACRTTQWV